MTSVIKLGCDPEVFLYHKSGVFMSADGKFPGTKREPFKVERGAVQVDGTALEFNIDAASNEDEWEKNITTVLSQMNEMVREVDKELSIVFRPIANFIDTVWETISGESKILGCDPDYDYRGSPNPNPGEKLLNVPLRTAAGHIHIGWTEHELAVAPEHFSDCTVIASHFHKKGIFNPTVKDEHERLKYYGMNGSFRPKHYGVELRSPSNIWVGSEETRRGMYNTVRKEFKEVTGL